MKDVNNKRIGITAAELNDELKFINLNVNFTLKFNCVLQTATMNLNDSNIIKEINELKNNKESGM